MKRVILLLALMFSLFAAHAQVNIPRQELRYNAHYHWGMVDVMIGHGVVTMECRDNRFNATIDGNSIPWEGRVFCISDTLHTIMSPTSGLSKETVTYENGWYLKPKVTEYRSGNFVPSDPANYKNIKGGGELDASANTMEAIHIMGDMLGMFYYSHEIDFGSMKPGSTLTIPIAVEGSNPEKVVVTYKGKSQYKIEGMTYPSYNIQFEYSYRGVMSGYQINAEIGVNDRIPLLISANLPIGHVQMIYNP